MPYCIFTSREKYHWGFEITSEQNNFHNDALTPQNPGKVLNASLVGLIREINDGRLTEPKGHNMLVYDGLPSFRGFYSEYAKKSLSSGEILILASQYEDVERVKRNLASCGIDVSGCLSEGTLHVLDAQKGYFGNDDVEKTFKLATELVSRVENEGRRTLSWIGDMGSFFAFHDLRRLIYYELLLPQKFDRPMQTMCCYHRKDFANLNQQEQRSLIGHHYKSIVMKA